MKPLIYLYLLRMKGNIRNLFSKPSSAIFVGIIVLVYGGMFVGVLINPGAAMTMVNITAINSAIFIGIGFTFLMVVMMLMQSRKSLFMENDAFYIFAGPFKRKHAMQFIMSQSIVGSLLCGVVSMFMMTVFGNFLEYRPIFLIFMFLSHSLVYFFFTILYYYVYLLSIKDKKYHHIPIYTLLGYGIIVLAIFVLVLAQNDFVLKDGAMKFLDSNLFYLVPLFGWIKLILVSCISAQWLLVVFGTCLLVGACMFIYFLMCSYKGEFVEKAMQDSIEFTKRYREMKAGSRSSMKDKKVREVSANFKEGAKAICSKNMVLMKKTNTFLQWQDVLFIGVYLVVSLIADLGFSFFCYMMIFWLFITIQNAEFMKEMNNYQIYLIPEKPILKLWYLIYPYLLKYMLLTAVPMLIGFVIMRPSAMEALQYYVMLAGYACLFIGASILATRILKSRNNPFLENMLRMFITALSAVPSIIILVILVNLRLLDETLMTWMSVLSLLMNFFIAGIILFGCRNMMNGREIKSE